MLREITFNDVWVEKPSREGANPKNKAMKAYNARVKQGVVPAEIIAGVIRYRNYCEKRQLTGSRFVMQMATFLGPDCHFENDWAITQNEVSSLVRSSRDLTLEEELSDRSWATPAYIDK